jgi:hypothetical protein
MAIYALVKDNILINRIEWDGVTAYNPGEGVAIYAITEVPPGVQLPAPPPDDA